MIPNHRPPHHAHALAQITESFRRFGISPTTTSLICIKVSCPAQPISSEAVKKHLAEVVKGTPVEFSDAAISQITDWAKVAKCYKIKTAGTTHVAPSLELEILGKLVMRAVG